MSLNRLFIVIGIVVLLVTGGVMWYWQYACTPQARARTIFAQVRGDTAGLRAWMLKHGLIREEVRPEDAGKRPFDPPDFNTGGHVTWDVSDEGPVFGRFVQLGPRTLPVIMEELSDANVHTREVAIVAAERLRNPQAVEAIVPLLADKDGDVRLKACSALVCMGTTRAVQAVFAAICDEKDPDVQWAMISQFGYGQETQVVPARIAGLKHGKGEVRRACADLLMESDDSRVPGALKEATGDPDGEVRSAAAWALEGLRSRQSATHPASK